MLRSLGFGLGLETFAKFFMISVSVSKNLVSEKSIGFGFGKFGIGKEVSVSVSEFLVSEKKYRFRFRKNLVSEKSLGFGFGKFGIGKKFRYRFRSKFWYCGQHHYPSQLWATP